MGGRLGAKEGKLPDGVREFSSDACTHSVDVAVLGGFGVGSAWPSAAWAVPIMSKSAAGGRGHQLSPTLHSIATCRRVMK